jgi:hypothetical protein
MQRTTGLGRPDSNRIYIQKCFIVFGVLPCITVMPLHHEHLGHDPPSKDQRMRQLAAPLPYKVDHPEQLLASYGMDMWADASLGPVFDLVRRIAGSRGVL